MQIDKAQRVTLIPVKEGALPLKTKVPYDQLLPYTVSDLHDRATEPLNVNPVFTLETNPASPCDTNSALPGDTNPASPCDTNSASPCDSNSAPPGDTNSVPPGDTNSVPPGDSDTDPALRCHAKPIATVIHKLRTTI